MFYVDTRGQSTAGFYAPNFDMLWSVAGKEMSRAGFPPDRDASSKANRVLVSRWQTQLMPFAGKGWREQATVTMIPVEGAANRWTVETNVTREVNANMSDPSNPGRVVAVVSRNGNVGTVNASGTVDMQAASPPSARYTLTSAAVS